MSVNKKRKAVSETHTFIPEKEKRNLYRGIPEERRGKS